MKLSDLLKILSPELWFNVSLADKDYDNHDSFLFYYIGGEQLRLNGLVSDIDASQYIVKYVCSVKEVQAEYDNEQDCLAIFVKERRKQNE